MNYRKYIEIVICIGMGLMLGWMIMGTNVQ
jgi:hypothetical protein